MAFRVVFLFAMLIVGCAMLFQLETFSQQREAIMQFIHHNLGHILKKCPYHLALDILKTIGLSHDIDGESESDATKTRVDVVRYEDDRLFTKDELSKYIGKEDSPGLYLGILGRVYDVQKGEVYYAQGAAYGFFSGCDGTKAFMTGQFNEQGLVDEVTGLSLPQMLELDVWIGFYEKTYTYKGKVIGNFYDENGKPTEALLDAKKSIDEAHKEKDKKEEHNRSFPRCSWSKERGGPVSCSNQSGGIKREWVGVPRKYHIPGSTNKPRCVCVRTTGPPHDEPNSKANRGDLDNPHLQLYDDCDPASDICKVS